MKNMLLFLALWAPVWVWGQRTVDYVLDTMPQVRYVAARFEVAKSGSNRVMGSLDFGQKLESRNGHVLCNAAKEPLVWETSLGGVNYLSGFGWRLIAVSEGRYILERRD